MVLIQRTARLARIVVDLDRCRHGQHEGDPCPSCEGGRSHGNPHLRPADTVGYSETGTPYTVPGAPANYADPAAWGCPTNPPQSEQPPNPMRAPGDVVGLIGASVDPPPDLAGTPEWITYVTELSNHLWARAFVAGAAHVQPIIQMITCPDFRAVSTHPTDATEGYCKHCHPWAGQAADH